MRGKLFSEVFGIVDSIIPKRTSLVNILSVVLEKRAMIATDLDTVVKVSFNEDYLTDTMIVRRESLKPILSVIGKTREIEIKDNQINIDNATQVLETIPLDQYPVYDDLRGMNKEEEWRLLFDTNDIYFTKILLDRLISMAKAISSEEYRPGLQGYIFDPEGTFIYTTDGHMLFGTDYKSVAYNVWAGANLDSFTMTDISKVLKKAKNVKTVKVEDISKWVRFTIYCDYYTIEITTRKKEGTMAASTIRRVIPKERGANTLQLTASAIDRLMSIFGKTAMKGVRFRKVGNEIECSDVNKSIATVFKFTDEYSNFEEVGYNITFLKAIADFYACDLLELNFKDTTGPARANIFDNDDIAIVMPVRISKTEAV